MRFGPLVIAILLALVAGFVALKMIGGKQEAAPVVAQTAPQQTDTANVYIASVHIPIGSVVSQDMITTQPWPSNLVGESFVTDQQPPETIIGKIARASFQQGEPIALTKLAGAGEGSFLAGSLPKGMRAVTINTDETMGVAGFIFPGDKVDILVTHQIPKWDKLTNQADHESITETLLSNVTVLAVDQIANAQEIEANNQNGQNNNGGNNGDAQSTIHVSRTATMMVNPVDGEKLRLGEKVGQLSMALRSIEDRDTVDMASLLRYQNITQFPLDSVSGGGASGAPGSGDGVRVVRGIEASNVAPVAPPASTAIPLLANPLSPTPAVTTASGTAPAGAALPTSSVSPTTASATPVKASPNVVSVPATTSSLPSGISAPAPLPASIPVTPAPTTAK